MFQYINIFNIVIDIKLSLVKYLNFRLKFKGIRSILFLKNGLKKNCRKNYKNHVGSNNYEVCTAVAHCFPNILDGIVLENIN
jgi:hypothetical protein